MSSDFSKNAEYISITSSNYSIFVRDTFIFVLFLSSFSLSGRFNIRVYFRIILVLRTSFRYSDDVPSFLKTRNTRPADLNIFFFSVSET